MIIAYDLRYASDHFAGIGTYAYSLIEELLALPGDDVRPNPGARLHPLRCRGGWPQCHLRHLERSAEEVKDRRLVIEHEQARHGSSGGYIRLATCVAATTTPKPNMNP